VVSADPFSTSDNLARSAAPEPMSQVTISIYLDDGRVFQYEVPTPGKAREHISAIIATGYRSVQASEPEVLTHYPPHRISKVKATGMPIPTNYTDREVGT
jgi:hypothetical protein